MMVWFKVYGNKKDQREVIGDYGRNPSTSRKAERSRAGGLHNQPKPERSAKKTSTKPLETDIQTEGEK